MHVAALAVVEKWSFQERSDPRVTPSIEILSLWRELKKNIKTNPIAGAVVTVSGVGSDMFKNTLI